MIKMIAVDIDGTLCHDDKSYNDEALKRILDIMNERNMKFVIATGNQYELCLRRFKSVKDDLVYLSENGTKIVYHDEILYTNTLSEEYKWLLLKELRKYPVTIVMCGTKHAYLEKKDQQYDSFIHKYYDNIEYVDSLDDVEDDILKYSIAEFTGKNGEIVEDLVKNIPDDIHAMTTGFEWFDIFHRSINKGVGMEVLQKYFNITKDECAAFGDQMNDYALLQSVKHSYAMKNAVDELKMIAENITEYDNNDDGVIREIEKILKM